MTTLLKRLLGGFVVVALVSYLLTAAALYFVQDYLLFPAIAFDKGTPFPLPPPGIDRFTANTADGETLEVWTNWKREKPTNFVALIFHGNGETVADKNFLGFFEELGVGAFTFDYRGFGKSSGWPSEEGIYLDADSVWRAVSTMTGSNEKQLIILGNSIGSGPAAYLAKKLRPKALILLAGYSDIPSVVETMPLHAPFRFLLRYRFPTSEYLQDLSDTCTVLAHGMRDATIPFSHLAKLESSISSKYQPRIIISESAGHNNLYYAVKDRLKAATIECLRENS